MIIIQDVSVVFGTDTSAVHALERVSMDIYEREFISIIGPSGCGKSTFLNLLGGLIDTTSGRLLFQGKPLSHLNQKGRLGYVFQEAVLLPWRNVIDNLLLSIEVLGKNRNNYRKRARELLELVGLKEFEHASPDQLSGGMKQRACIARALIFDPSILLMDEPFGALDEITRTRMNIELQDIWLETEKTIVFVTHSVQEAAFLSDRVAVMSSRPGRIIATVEIPFQRPRSIDLLSEPRFLKITSELRNHLYGSFDEEDDSWGKRPKSKA
ncbi:MAG: ABC transporter ATP-binding protein [Deltaproteobacteria bacterium]|nr:ABC transporter ATP-binding protein [Deltaproteobacteria bacterium]